MPVKLTKSYIERITPGPKDEFYWDTEVKGFGVRVTPSGKLSFIVQGRVKDSSAPALRITIGAFGVFTVDQARDEAREHLRNMRKGLDPREARKADEAMRVTLSEVMESYVDRPGQLRASTADEYRRHVEKVFAAWKDRPIASITEDDVRKRHREIVEKGLDGKRGAPASANAAMVTLRILMNYAGRQYRRGDGTPLIQRNPVDVLRDHWAKLGTRNDRYIDKRKIGDVWNALNKAREAPKNPDALASLDLALFCLLTGCRRNEAATLEWRNVKIDGEKPDQNYWHIDVRKRGEPLTLPLSSQAVDLLKARKAARPRNEHGKESPFVFPSWSETGHITEARAPMQLVSRTVGEPGNEKHLSLHDLRRTFTNIAMRECLIEKFRTDLLTGHKPAQEDVTSRNYLDLANLDWLQPEVQRIGDWIEAQAKIAAAKAAGANVVPIRA